MKEILIFIASIFFCHSVLGQTPGPSEIKFKLYNEDGTLLNCDSLTSDKISIVELSSVLDSYAYDPVTMYHKINITTFGSHLALHWERNGKVMDLFFNIYDTTGTAHYSFDKIKFEEGKYKINVRNSADRITFEKSKTKYFETFAIEKREDVIHYAWESIVNYEVVKSEWNNFFPMYKDNRQRKRIKCR